MEILLPLHKSPAVREALLPELTGHHAVHVVEPLGYPDFAATLADCDLVLTDSGGIQEEAPSLGKPALVLRTTTERPEAVEAGAARLIGTDPEAILGAATRLLDDPAEYHRMATMRQSLRRRPCGRPHPRTTGRGLRGVRDGRTR